MRFKSQVCWVAAASIVLQGCTTLRVSKAGDTPQSRRGIAYFLPFTQFETKITWTAACDKSTNDLKISPAIEATAKTGPDPDGLYVIDYASLSAFTKTSSVKVDFYDSGAIKSINASADDRTGEIATSVVTAAAKLAKIAFIGAGTSATCSPELITALKAVKVAKDDVDKKTGKLKLATDQLTAFSARLTREGASVTDAMRAQHSKLIGNVVALQMELDTLKGSLDEAREDVTFVKTVMFPETSGQVAMDKGIVVPDEVLKKWLVKAQADNASSVGVANAVWLDLKASGGFMPPARVAGGTSPQEGTAEDGIRYRVTVPGKLRMCKAGACAVVDKYEADLAAGQAPVKPKAQLVKALPVKLLQQNTTFFMPFRSKAFTNGALSATFAESGVMTSAGYEQKKAQGEVLAALSGTLADQATSLYEAKHKNDKTALQLIEEETKIAEAKKKRKLAEDALVEAAPDPNADYIAGLASDTSIKAAELANINASIAVAEARKKYAEAGGQ